jgi:hypothetical protein
MSLKDRIPARTSYKFLLWFLTAAFTLSTAAQLFGQLETGKISGTVRDTSGAVIPDATVTVKSVATGAERSVQSGSIGQYLIPSLTPGSYEVTVTNKGFKTFRTSVEVTVGGSATL